MKRTAPLPMRDWNSADLDPALVFASLLRAHAMIVAELQPRFVDAGLPAFDVARLLWLWSERGVDLELRDVATRLWLSRSAASRLVGRAEQVGLVERSRDVFDQRDVSVGITTHGRSVVHRLDAVLRASARAIGLDDDELQRLADLVGRIARRYERI